LKRKYVRISLGGLHDEAEIRGHRKTYIGAMPGRIIKGLVKAGTSNPVFILDEIDKVSQMTNQGDPSSALLEVLDPEQNNAFHDNFLDIDFDLSKVMFIATANNLNTISAPLLDRMEIIEVSGYITEEKIEIAKRHLIPKEMEANGIPKGSVSIPKNTIEAIIENYTRESGVRDLEKKIGKIFRRLACQYASDGEFKNKNVKPEDLKELLGAKPYTRDKYQGNDYAGVVTGLAWTAVGGEILFVETSLSRERIRNARNGVHPSTCKSFKYRSCSIQLMERTYPCTGRSNPEGWPFSWCYYGNIYCFCLYPTQNKTESCNDRRDNFTR
jgi:ATP-dependent Lon protease